MHQPYGQKINRYIAEKSTLVGMHISIPDKSGERNNAALDQKWFTFYINRLVDDEIQRQAVLMYILPFIRGLCNQESTPDE